jgi:hypothetical protein
MKTRARRGIQFTVVFLATVALAPLHVRAAQPIDRVTALLDGTPIPLREVGDWYCEDFSSPQIRCYTEAAELEATVSGLLAVQAIDYVTVYDYPTYSGSYMHVSQDYSVLALIGWNDRISSFRGRNYESGVFFTDWFYSGVQYGFCCNQQASSLGGFDNTFSSIHRD